MSVVQSPKGLLSVNTATNHTLGSPAVNLNGVLASYGYLYASQPAVRTAVDYLARSISRVPMYAYMRSSATERTRLLDGPIAKTMNAPWPGCTRSSWYADMIRDLMIYDQFVGIKVKTDDGSVGVVRVPQEYVELRATNFMQPDSIVVRGLSGSQEYTMDQVVFIKGYNPIYGQNYRGLSPMETLRHVLAELDSASRYREGFWKQAARISGVIERPPAAPKWSPEARARFRNDWQSAYAGDSGSGKTAVLEDGMSWKPASFSASDSQYLESITLTRAQVASAFGIDPVLLGIGEKGGAHMDVSHRMMLVETLTPHLIRIQEELSRQLLPELTNDPRIELAFDTESLQRGTFEEQVTIYQAAVGAPWLTRNEARMRAGLTPLPDGDALVTPLNVVTGGLANPQDTVSVDRQLQSLVAAPKSGMKSASGQNARVKAYIAARDEEHDALTAVIKDALARHKSAVLSKYGAAKANDPEMKAAKESVFNSARFKAETKTDVKKALTKTAQKFGSAQAKQYGNAFNAEDGMANYLDGLSDVAADAMGDAAESGIDLALESDSPEESLNSLFDEVLIGVAMGVGMSLITSAASSARADAAQFAGAGTKTWIVASANPRESHAAIDGEEVAMGETFSNGLRWPGDSEVEDAYERANCTCMVDFSQPEGDATAEEGSTEE